MLPTLNLEDYNEEEDDIITYDEMAHMLMIDPTHCVYHLFEKEVEYIFIEIPEKARLH